MKMPQIVYLQTITKCNGHCRYCPFDDVYADQPIKKMDIEDYILILEWLKENKYKGRIGFLLHYEPTLDDRLEEFVGYAKIILPNIRLEVATNGIVDSKDLNLFDDIKKVDAGSLKIANSRAGNVKSCPEIISRKQLEPHPCPIPEITMCIAANGEVLLCCQDWRHEAVIGTIDDLDKARINQLECWEKVKRLELEMCQDCMAGKTAEEVGERLGERFI